MRISIITINYNNRIGLERTIKSVVSQTYSNIQYIVIDGASTDGSVEAISNYQDKIDYWVSEPDSGIYQAMNKGVDKSDGSYLLFLNSGDSLFLPTTIQNIVAKLDGTDVVMGKVKCMPSGYVGWADIQLPLTMLDFYTGGPVPHQATFINRVLFNQYRYDENLKIVSDWKFFIQTIVFSNCTCKIVDDIVSYFEEGGISSRQYLCDQERMSVLTELLPERVRLDYLHFVRGNGYREDDYDQFFIKLRQFNYAKYIYSLSVLLVRLLSFLKPSARFARDFCIKWKGK